MKFRNPWIDPRVATVKVEAARHYLVRHGWIPLTPEPSHMHPFAKSSDDGEVSTVLLPTREQGRDYRQRIIDLITHLALSEGRYAVDILNDILHQRDLVTAPSNGPPLAPEAQPVSG